MQRFINGRKTEDYTLYEDLLAKSVAEAIEELWPEDLPKCEVTQEHFVYTVVTSGDIDLGPKGTLYKNDDDIVICYQVQGNVVLFEPHLDFIPQESIETMISDKVWVAWSLLYTDIYNEPVKIINATHQF